MLGSYYWIIFVVLLSFGSLVWVLIGEAISREPLGRWVDSHTADQKFSLARVAYLVVRTAVVFVILAIVVLLLRSR